MRHSPRWEHPDHEAIVASAGTRNVALQLVSRFHQFLVLCDTCGDHNINTSPPDAHSRYATQVCGSCRTLARVVAVHCLSAGMVHLRWQYCQTCRVQLCDKCNKMHHSIGRRKPSAHRILPIQVRGRAILRRGRWFDRVSCSRNIARFCLLQLCEDCGQQTASFHCLGCRSHGVMCHIVSHPVVTVPTTRDDVTWLCVCNSAFIDATHPKFGQCTRTRRVW